MKIGEYLTGQSMQGYIPIEKRQSDEPVKRDGEAARSQVLHYIKEHEGEEINVNDVQLPLIGTPMFRYHLKVLVDTGQLKKVGGKGDGSLYARYYLPNRHIDIAFGDETIQVSRLSPSEVSQIGKINRGSKYDPLCAILGQLQIGEGLSVPPTINYHGVQERMRKLYSGRHYATRRAKNKLVLVRDK